MAELQPPRSFWGKLGIALLVVTPMLASEYGDGAVVIAAVSAAVSLVAFALYRIIALGMADIKEVVPIKSRNPFIRGILLVVQYNQFKRR